MLALCNHATAVALLLVALAGAASAQDGSGGWTRSRATFYDAPPYWQQAYIDRGQGSFGDILYGACGFYEQPLGAKNVTYDDLPFGLMTAAIADTHPDYPGARGRAGVHAFDMQHAWKRREGGMAPFCVPWRLVHGGKASLA